MSIKDLKDLQGEEFGFPEAGRIRLGMMKTSTKSGKDYPVEADHFVLKDALDLIPHYGQQPKELLVYLPYQTLERNFRAFYEEFRSGGLYCQGDGERINWAVDPGKSGQVVIRNGVVVAPYKESDGSKHEPGETMLCPGNDRATNPLYPRCANCRARALFFVLVRDPHDPLRFVNGRLAYYRVSTGSIHNIINLTRNLNMLAALAAGLGKGLAGIPMILKRTPGAITITNEDGKRAQVEKHFLQLEVDPIWAQIGALSMAAQALNRPVEELLKLPEVASTQPNGDYEDDVVDGQAFVPEDLQEVDERMAQTVADIESLKDSVPANWGEFHNTIKEFFGTAYDSTRMLRELRAELGIGRTEELPLNVQVWRTACELVIGRLKAA